MLERYRNVCGRSYGDCIHTGSAAIKAGLEDDIKQSRQYKDITAVKCDIFDGNTRISSSDWNADSNNGTVGGFWTAIERHDDKGWRLISLTGNVTLPPQPSK
jgi:hypothetical protein